MKQNNLLNNKKKMHIKKTGQNINNNNDNKIFF